MFMSCNDECGDIHGKEFLNYSKFHHEFWRSHFEENVRPSLQNWWANKKRSIIWTTFIGERIHGNVCHWLVMNSYQSSAHTSLCLLRFCVCASGESFNIRNPEAWKKRIEGITSSQSYRNFDGIDGESTEFEWNIFPGFTTLQLLR